MALRSISGGTGKVRHPGRLGGSSNGTPGPITNYSRNWNDGSLANQTIFGAGSPSQSVVSQKLQVTNSASQDASSRFDAITTFQNGTIQVDLGGTLTASALGGIVFRNTTWTNVSNDYAYCVYASDGGLSINRGANGAGSGAVLLNTSLSAIGTATTLTVTVNGGNITGRATNGTEVFAYDTTYSSAGGIGLLSSVSAGGSELFDNFSSDWGPYTDPYFSNVVTLLQLNGTNGGTSFPDITGKTWTRNGDAQTSTSQYKWTGSSLLLDGTGDYLTTPNHVDFQFGSGDFTIEGWFRPTDSTVGHGIVSKMVGGGFGPFAVFQNASNLQFYASSNGSSWDLVSGASIGTVLTNTWYHFAVCRSGTNIYCFLNGTLTTTVSSVVGSLYADTNAVSIGALGNGSPFQGNMNDIRLTKGVARYTSTFIRPQQPFATS